VTDQQVDKSKHTSRIRLSLCREQVECPEFSDVLVTASGGWLRFNPQQELSVSQTRTAC
jgi:hypothetical protein